MTKINPIGSTDENPLLPMGRLVFGNPLVFAQSTDYNTKRPKVAKDGVTPVMECTFGFAIPKAGEQHWAQTPWGALLYAEGSAAFPTMIARDDFAWKIIDGDSPKPNKAGTIINSKEGYAGHWVMTLSTRFGAVRSFKVNQQFGTTDECIAVTDIKTGDYGRLVLTCNNNKDATGNAQTPGLYLNPLAFCKDKDGVAIVGEGQQAVDVNAAFGGVAPTAGYVAPQQQATSAQYVTPIAPNTAYMTPPPPASEQTPPPAPTAERVLSNGFTATQLRNAGWPETAIAALG